LAGTDAAPTLCTLICTGAIVPSGPLSAGAPKFQGPEQPAEASGGARSLHGPFALAVMELWRGRETGVLRCVSPLDNRAVYISRGVPVFARSERNADRLDQMLVRQGVITPEQAQRSLELQTKTPSKRIGQILLEMGAITLETLHSTVKTQVQNLVLSLFTWSDGKYLFEPGPLPTQEAITLDWDTPGAVLQGLRGLPLAYIRPLAPPKDAIIARATDTSILRELQLNSAEQKLFALILGKHPMEQLLALDFIANESLLRGLVTFAALGLVVVHRPDIPIEEGEGEVIDPSEPYVRSPPPVPEAPAFQPRRVQSPDNIWPDPVPREQRKAKFVPGPALAAFEAERSRPPAAEDEGVFQFVAPAETPAPAEPPARQQAASESAVSDAVPRSMYDAAVAEKHDLQQRLFAVLDERNASDRVPRELFDQVQAEKRQLQEKMMLMLDELLRLRQQPAKQEPDEKSNVRPFPGSRKNE
jgi:hypothetical protein